MLALVALVALLAACTRDGSRATAPDPLAATLEPARAVVTLLPSVRISEIHYDNAGADVQEGVEISGPAGTSLDGWRVIPYNGAGGAAYDPKTLSNVAIPATCGARGVVVVPIAGLQNGSPDGVALVDANNTVIEFLSYEGTFTATGGPASGLLSTDIGVSQSGSEPLIVVGGATLVRSLQRTPAGTWSAPDTSTFGRCNDDDSGTPPRVITRVTVSPDTATIVAGASVQLIARAFDESNTEITGVAFGWTSATTTVATVSPTGLATGVAPGTSSITALAPTGIGASAEITVTASTGPTVPDVRFTEIHYDNVGVDVNERIEIEGPAGTDLAGWQVLLYNGNGGAVYNTTALTGTIPATCGARGVIVVSYPQDNVQNGSPDGVALVDARGSIIEFLSYEGTFAAADGPAAGRTSVDIGVAESSTTPYGRSLQRSASGVWSATAASFGACNGGGGTALTNASIAVSGRDAINDPPLPVGFQDQIFGTVRDANGAETASAVTWMTLTPAIATIEATTGVVTALAPGAATLRATVANGVVADFVLPTRVATPSTTAQYDHNTEFGEPADGDPSDDFILRRREYTSSYSRLRNTPNWVAYDIDATHFGAEDRCDCFTFDPLLPADFTRYTTADYTGAGAVAGYGIDRGHLARSFDRTSASLDNARSFYFSNIIPQANDVNTGPWAGLETFLGDQARLNDKEVFVIAGVAGSKGTVKNQGIITIPAAVWKVAVILPRDQGLANVVTGAEPEIVAVIMPNDPNVSTDWRTYRTTVDAVEALSGYDLLALLPDAIEAQLEKGNAYPVVTVTPPSTWTQGAAANLAIAFTDTNIKDAPFTVRIDWGDGSALTQFVSTILPAAPFLRPHVYAAAGSYTITATVTDRGGATTTKTVVIRVQP